MQTNFLNCDKLSGINVEFVYNVHIDTLSVALDPKFRYKSLRPFIIVVDKEHYLQNSTENYGSCVFVCAYLLTHYDIDQVYILGRTRINVAFQW
jgi:hypothetical protein